MMDAADYVLVHDAEGVRFITLNRLAKANALNAAMLDSIRQACASAQPDRVALIVLRSASPTLFCAGGDIEEFVRGPALLERQGVALRELTAAMACCPVPILAVARGKAAGAGVILLTMTDIVIAAADLALSCPEMAFSMYPVMVQAVLETKISSARARQLCFSGQSLDAGSARDLGLVTDVLAVAGFDGLAAQRLDYYARRRHALAIARQARLMLEPPVPALQRVLALEPLMHENYHGAGVQEAICSYLARLGGKPGS
ncbi:enoyl-CoA hydratase/isomerase family protein [Bordetella petrii]|uniref:enoyl-CoA hydratase/isomerase family protein n=1 Tax=Bordetella petrii TaxID=94624 RepID=UPI001E3AC1A8|nr:enoyl-CoA hydratase/isomerase family protein [Bordetella petrii]MCD0502291.1 enoyl-CoA hydratase/isomerase family protein [Bordetella petrii]